MIDTSLGYTLDYAYRRGSASPPQLNSISITVGLSELLAFGSVVYKLRIQNNPLLNHVDFGFADSAVSFPLTAKYDGTAAGTSPATVTGLGYNGVSFTAAKSIDSVSAASSSPLSITTAYNALFGTTKTNAEVYAELKRIYGDHEVFCYATGGGSGAMPFVGANSYNFNFYQNADTIKIHIPRVTNFAGASYPTGYDSCFMQGDIEIDSDFLETIGSDTELLAAYLIFKAPDLQEKLRFNVYVDGVIGGKGPNIYVTWTNTVDPSELSPELIKPHIWCWPVPQPESPEIIARPPVVTVDGVKIPEDDRLRYNQVFSWDGSLETDYIGMATPLISQYSTIDKVAYYGLDGIPDKLRFYLRFDYSGTENEQIVNTWGDLYYVDIPYEYNGIAYIEAVKVDDSSYSAIFDTEVILIGGTPPEDIPDDPDESEQGFDGDGEPSEDGRYPDPTYKPDLTGYDSEGYPGQAVLTRTYALTALELQNVGNKLWTQDYFDVLKVQANPIENIIACRWYPMALTGINADIVIGDVDFDLNKPMISTTYKKTIGSFKYTGQMTDSNGKKVAPGYLAQSPYTTLKLHLPYVGTIQLDASEIFDASLSIQYVVDIVSGDLIAFLRLDGQPYMNVSGKMGVDIPLSGTDRAQVQIANASRAVSAMAGAAGASMLGNTGKAANELLGGAMSIMGSDYTTQRVCTHSSVCASYENRAVVMEVIAPKTYISDGFKSIHGFPSHQYMKPYKGMGFIKTTPTTVVNVAMTDTENQELSRILASGCYF